MAEGPGESAERCVVTRGDTVAFASTLGLRRVLVPFLGAGMGGVRATLDSNLGSGSCFSSEVFILLVSSMAGGIPMQLEGGSSADLVTLVADFLFDGSGGGIMPGPSLREGSGEGFL